MAIQSQPSRIPEPFAGSGTKNTIPATNATPSASQAASWASGFPPECSQPISAGGCPVPRNDVNGALNQLSQDFAFRQDGGIWEWSALADYDTQRMVRGSDGLLYWSVAQSGPGFGAGAVDPTTDDGTYWSSPALKTMGLGDKSMAGATTEWVKNLVVAPIYVDAVNGSDSNNGFSETVPVKTINKALEIALFCGAQQEIFVSDGTYNENIVLDGDTNCKISLLGNVVINGKISITNNSCCMFSSEDYSLTVYGNVNIAVGSTGLFYCNTSISYSENDDIYPLLITQNSFCYFNKNLTVTGNGSKYCIDTQYDSFLVVNGTANIVNGGINIYATSSNFFIGTVSITGTYPDVSAIWLTRQSSAQFNNDVSIVGPTNIQTAVFDASSVCVFEKNLTITNKANKNCIQAFALSYFGVNGVLKITSSSSLARFVYADASMVVLQDINFSGTVTTNSITAMYKAYVSIPSSASVSGSVTGVRYYVSNNSYINVGGAGANRIPGSQAGTVVNNTYSLYG